MRRRACLVAALFLLISCASASAGRKWYPPQQITAGGAVNPHGAMDSHGSAYALFATTSMPYDRVLSANRVPGGLFSPPAEAAWVHSRSVGQPGVETLYDSDDRAVALWIETTDNGNSRRIKYATRKRGSPHWNGRELSGSNPSVPVAAADGRGTVYAAWIDTRNPNEGCCDPPKVAEMHHGGDFGAARQFSSRGGPLSIDAASTGAAALGWTGATLVVKPAGGSFGSEEKVPGLAPGFNLSSPRVAIDADGAVIVAQLNSQSGPTPRVTVVVRSPAGQYSQPRVLSGPTGNPPQVVAGPAGEAVVAWVEGGQGPESNATVRASVRQPDGTFGPPQTLAAGDATPSPPGLAMDDLGNAIVAWGSEQGGVRTIFATDRSPGSGFGRARAISEPTGGYDPQYQTPWVAFGGPGNAMVLWSARSNVASRSDAAFFDVVRPRASRFRAHAREPRMIFRWRLSEESRVVIRLQHAGVTQRTLRTRSNVGRSALRVPRKELPAGRYVALLRATDRALNRSGERKARFVLPRR